MIRYVHQSPKFVKHLSALCNGGKKAAMIAQKAESILRLLRNQGYIRPDQLETTKRYVDRRIKNCTKYDLGSGYRLITVTENEHLFFCISVSMMTAFVGSITTKNLIHICSNLDL